MIWRRHNWHSVNFLNSTKAMSARLIPYSGWVGYFMRGEFEKAAMTFSEFNSAFPGMPDLWIRRCGLLSRYRILPRQHKLVKYMRPCPSS